MSDRNPGSEPAARGFSTRALQAASRAPRVGHNLTASLGCVHTMVVNTPSTSPRQSSELEAPATSRESASALGVG